MVTPYDRPHVPPTCTDSLAYASSAVYGQVPATSNSALPLCADDDLSSAPSPYSLVSWPKTIHVEQFRRDTDLIHESMTLPAAAPDDLAAQVFGRQLCGERLSAQHLANVLYERAALYSRHASAIDHRHGEVQSEFFFLKLFSPHVATREQQALEKMVLNLETERRKAELDFWKDTHDIRQELLERIKAYQVSKHRVSLLAGPERYDATS